MKDEKWGDKAYYIEPLKVGYRGTACIGDIREVNVTKHGRIYNTCDYSRWGTRFSKDTGMEDASIGSPVRFYPTREMAERKRKEYVLWMEMLRWHCREGGRKFSSFTDDELDTIIDILKGAENRG